MFGETITNWVQRLRLTAKGRIQFYRALQTFQRGNVQMEGALIKIREMYSRNGKRPNNVIALMADDGAHGYGSGRFLHQALEDWLPPDECSILASGVQTGKMEDAFQQAIKLAQSKRLLLRGVLGEMLQPFSLLLVAAGVLYMLAVNVIPDFLSNRDPGAPLVGAAFNLYWFSYAVKNFWWLFVLGGFGLCVAIYMSFSRWTGPVRLFFDRLPPWSIYKEVQGCVFLMNVAVLQRSGMIVMDVLTEMKAYSTPWMNERLDLTLIGLAQGQNLGEALQNAECSFPSDSALPFLRVLAAQDGADEHIAAFAEERLADSIAEIKTSAAGLSLGLLVLVAFVAGGISAGLNALSAI
ncbi:type II secretion system F family protein [Achromobacter insuavis]|uniref:type II secretion system F family protein n=1 Tax=Achromobacter insuavis TaxID=1287735 RepID=UPI001F133E0F|nr:type II secretion system F family protein [Achromobacter insuavis]